MKSLEDYTRELKYTLDRLALGLVEEVVNCLHQARMNGQQVFVIGNGGSAATATHLACDLGKNTVSAHAPRFRVISLTDNMAVFSAIGNDLGYENVFAEQLANLVQPGDVVIAISASGNSPNVLKAIKLAKLHEAHTIGWSGYDGGKLATLVDIPVVVPNHCIEQIEDIHMMLGHMVTTAVRQAGNLPVYAPPTETLPELHGLMVNGNHHLRNGKTQPIMA